MMRSMGQLGGAVNAVNAVSQLVSTFPPMWPGIGNCEVPGVIEAQARAI